MIILRKLEPAPPLPNPIGLTIGSFDGVHLGHQTLLTSLRQEVGPPGTLAVLTFSSHPSHVLKRANPVPLITSPPRKEALLEEMDIDLLYHIPFTTDLASLTYDAFLKKLHTLLPFTLLLLGAGASLGKDRAGTPESVAAIAPSLGFQATYLPLADSAHGPICSREIRTHIAAGDLRAAIALLGHPIYYEGTLQPDGRFLPTSDHPCLPANGAYPAQLLTGSEVLDTEFHVTKSGCLIEGQIPSITSPITLRISL